MAKVLCVCDICNKPIKTFMDYREVQLMARKDFDVIVDTVWEHQVCMKCALDLEQDIIRKKKLIALRSQDE